MQTEQTASIRHPKRLSRKAQSNKCSILSTGGFASPRTPPILIETIAAVTILERGALQNARSPLDRPAPPSSAQSRRRHGGNRAFPSASIQPRAAQSSMARKMVCSRVKRSQPGDARHPSISLRHRLKDVAQHPDVVELRLQLNQQHAARAPDLWPCSPASARAQEQHTRSPPRSHNQALRPPATESWLERSRIVDVPFHVGIRVRSGDT